VLAKVKRIGQHNLKKDWEKAYQWNASHLSLRPKSMI
jgi:hypothetical protein